VRHILNQPGKPTQNAYIESFNGKFRDVRLATADPAPPRRLEASAANNHFVLQLHIANRFAPQLDRGQLAQALLSS
jgi:transposase InsO family protein